MHGETPNEASGALQLLWCLWQHTDAKLLFLADLQNGLQMAEPPKSKKELQLERFQRDAEVLQDPASKNHWVLGIINAFVRSELC